MKKNIQQPTPANPCQPLQVKFNVENWYIKRAGDDKINLLKKERATIVNYFPTTGTVHYKLQENSIGYQIWNVTRGYLTAHIGSEGCELKVNQSQLNRHFEPVNDIEDLDVNDIETGGHFWDSFGRSETESFMRWLIIECQKAGKFQPIKCGQAHQELCEEGLLYDFGNFHYLPTRKAIRKLAGAGFYKPL